MDQSAFFMKTGLFFIVAVSFLLLASCDPQDTPVNNPDANFSIAGYERPAPTTLTFLNTSSNANTYLWNFGDGTTSPDFNPTHLYNFPGTFQVTLKVTGSGQTDSICKLVSIEPPVVANKSSFSYFLDRCSGAPVGAAFKTLNPASQNTVWDFNGVLNTSRDPIIQFIAPGDYTIKYSSQIGSVRDTVIRIIRLL